MRAKELFPGIFSRHAEAYAERHAEIAAAGGEAARNRMLELVAVGSGERVLDVACGPGNLSERLLAAGALVTGIDLAEGMLEVARRRAPAATFLLMDGERLEFPEGTFDAAVCGHGYQFMPDLPRAFAEARRVIRAGGRLGATLPQAGSPTDILDEVAGRWLAEAPAPSDTAGTRALVADAEALRATLWVAGFGHVDVEPISQSTVWRDADHAVSLATAFWSLAARIELTPPARVAAFEQEARAALRRRFGEGPIRREVDALVIYAVA